MILRQQQKSQKLQLILLLRPSMINILDLQKWISLQGQHNHQILFANLLRIMQTIEIILESNIILQLQSEHMLEYSNQNCSFAQDASYLKLKHINRYREKQYNTLSEASNYPLYPSLSKPKHKTNCCDSQNDSIDTCQSDQSINLNEAKRTKPNKLKVQLCKNFVEKGYCPYESRCRFAHGIEQLRAKDTYCSSDLYRTRKCRIFFEKYECKFGQRCNFMHDNRTLSEISATTSQSVRSALRCQFLEVGVLASTESRLSSRLLSILQVEHKSP